MMFESKYRRQAMAEWEQSREQELEQLKQDLHSIRERVGTLKRKLKEIAMLLIHRRNGHT